MEASACRRGGSIYLDCRSRVRAQFSVLACLSVVYLQTTIPCSPIKNYCKKTIIYFLLKSDVYRHESFLCSVDSSSLSS